MRPQTVIGARPPCYVSSMSAQRQAKGSFLRGVVRPSQPPAEDSASLQAEPAYFVKEAMPGLGPDDSILEFGNEVQEPWDYVPVPPVVVDADGYLVSDSMSQNERHLGRLFVYGPALKEHYRERGGMVGADLSMPYVKGSPGKMLSPDLFVTPKAHERGDRDSYKLWQEPVPEFVLEDLSPNTWRRDVVDKRELYRQLGVQEYWMFDEAGRRLRDDIGRRLGVRLVGYRLHKGEYKRVQVNDAGRLPSKVLGLELCVRDDLVRFFDPETGSYLPTFRELRAQADASEAEAEVARAEATKERMGREMAEQQAAAALARVEALEAQLRAKG